MGASVCITSDYRGLALDQWSFVLSHWQPDEIFVLGGRPEEWVTAIPMRKAIGVSTAAELPDTPLVVLAPDNGYKYQGRVSLVDFTHPEDAIYLFGSNHRHLTEDEFGDREPDHLVYIPTDTNDQMYAWVAAAITFYDRKVKRG